jgi:hypothetical protein
VLWAFNVMGFLRQSVLLTTQLAPNRSKSRESCRHPCHHYQRRLPQQHHRVNRSCPALCHFGLRWYHICWNQFCSSCNQSRPLVPNEGPEHKSFWSMNASQCSAHFAPQLHWSRPRIFPCTVLGPVCHEQTNHDDSYQFPNHWSSDKSHIG